MKKTQSKATAALTPKDWKELINVKPGDYLAAVQAKLFPRATEMKLAARRAYETAPIGGEVAAIWDALKGYQNLDNSEIFGVMDEIPLKKVADGLWALYMPIRQKREADAERRELARRRRVLAKLEAGKKQAQRKRKGAAK